jgi:hypothetical protein
MHQDKKIRSSGGKTAPRVFIKKKESSRPKKTFESQFYWRGEFFKTKFTILSNEELNRVLLVATVP